MLQSLSARNLTSRIHEIILITLVIINSIIWSLFYVLRYNIYGFHTDTGSYEQSIWNTLQGDILESTLAVSVYPFNTFSTSSVAVELPSEIIPFIFSTLHANLIAIIYSPIYALAPFTETLLVTSAVLLSFGAIPLYLIAKNELKNKTLALIISISYLLSPGLLSASMADFNYLTFSVPILFFAFYFMRKENWIPYWVLIALTLTIREELSLVVLFFGLYIFFFQKKRIIGAITIVIGAISFALLIFVIFPTYIPHETFSGTFITVGQHEGIKGIIKTLFTNPAIIFEHLFTSSSGYYLFQIFSHTAFLSFLSPSAFLISIPELFKNLLADPPHMRLMWNHYQLLIQPGLFVSTVFAIKKILNRFSNKRSIIILLCLILLFSAFLSNSLYSAAPLTSIGISTSKDGIKFEDRFVWWEFLNFKCCLDYTINNKKYLSFRDQINSVNHAISLIPENASVSSQDGFVSHLSRRSELYLFPIYYDKVEYVLVVETEISIFGTGFLPQELHDKYVSKLRNDGNHKIIFNENGLLLFKKLN